MRACYKVTKGHHLTEDLIQELAINILKLDNKFLNKLTDKEKFRYFYQIANNMFWLKKSKFYLTYRTNTTEIKEHHLKEEENFNMHEYLVELDMSPDERLWIRTYLTFEGNYTWISDATGISRQRCAKRIKYIGTKHGRNNN